MWMQGFFEEHKDSCKHVNLISRDGLHFLISEASEQGVGAWDGWEDQPWDRETFTEVIMAPFEEQSAAFHGIVEFLQLAFALNPVSSVRRRFVACFPCAPGTNETLQPFSVQVSRVLSTAEGGAAGESYHFAGLPSNTENEWRLHKFLESAGCTERIVLKRSYSDFTLYCGVGSLCQCEAADVDKETAASKSDLLLVTVKDFLPVKLSPASVDWGKLRVQEVSDQGLDPIPMEPVSDDQATCIRPMLGLTTSAKGVQRGRKLAILHFVSR